MEVEWRLFADLADSAGDRRISVEVGSEPTVRDALEALLSSHPALRERVTSETGDLRDHINVLQNGEQISSETLETAVNAGDELALLPPVSGG